MFLKHTWPGIVWAIFILVLCAIPGQDLQSLWWLELLSFDKLVHAGMFAVLTILLVKGFMRQDRFMQLATHPVTYAISISVPYGFALELMQRFLIEGRTFDILDAVANAIGCLIGWRIVNRMKLKSQQANQKGFE